MDVALVDLRIAQTLLHRLDAFPEEVHAQLLEPCPRDRREEINSFVQRINLDGGLGGRHQSPLRPLAGRPKPAQIAGVAADVRLVLSSKVCNKMVNHPAVEVLTSEARVACRGLDFVLSHGVFCLIKGLFVSLQNVASHKS